MKKRWLAIVLMCVCCNMAFSQSEKIDPRLREVMANQTDDFRVIVMMSSHYDDLGLAAKTQFMDKTQRREFVINDRKAFCQASQDDVLRHIQVTELKQFWSMNGFSCLADANTILELSEREDVAWIVYDPLRNMIPETMEAKPVTSKDQAWHVGTIHAPEVWNYNGSTGYNGNGVVVGHLDSGVNYNHLDLVNSMWDGGPEFPHHGYDVVNQDDDPMDDHLHGTHTAGIIAGQGVAGIQTGIAPGAKIMAIKVIDQNGDGSDAQVIEGIEFALEHGADLISMSLGEPGAGPCAFYREVFSTVMQAGLAAAVAAGNDGQTQYTYPVPVNINSPGNCPPPWLHPDQQKLISGGLTAVVCVGASDINDEHADFSSVGPVTWSEGPMVGSYNDYPYANGDATKPGLIRPDISAPGANVTSLNYQTTNDYIAYDGTSMATPCVAGVMAMLLEADPSLTPAALDSIIELTAVMIGNSQKNNIVGSGRIDALEAMNALFHHGPTNLTASFDGDQVELSWTPAPDAVFYSVYRDGMRIANELTAPAYNDHLTYASTYTYYVKATLDNGMVTLPSNYVTLVKPALVDAEVINNKRVELSWNMPSGIFDGFESGDLYQNMWINDATYPWDIVAEGAHSGTYCVKSKNKTMFSTSKISLGVSVPTTCVVSYYAKISCFPLNGGGFFIDNVQYGETLKDEIPWTRYSVALSPGNHLLEWKYGNQLAEGDYENAFFVDDITVGNAFRVYRADCTGNQVVLLDSTLVQAHFVDYDWEVLPLGQYKYGVSANGGATIDWSDCLTKDVMAVNETSWPEMNLYPNPSRDQVTIEYEGAKNVKVVSVLGQIMVEATVDAPRFTLSLDQFQPGLYFVVVQGTQGTVTKPLSVEP